MRTVIYKSVKCFNGDPSIDPLDFILFAGYVTRIGTIKRLETEDSWLLENWTVEGPPVHAISAVDWKQVTAREAIQMMYHQKVKDILDLCPEEEHEFIKEDLQKYIT